MGAVLNLVAVAPHALAGKPDPLFHGLVLRRGRSRHRQQDHAAAMKCVPIFMGISPFSDGDCASFGKPRTTRQGAHRSLEEPRERQSWLADERARSTCPIHGPWEARGGFLGHSIGQLPSGGKRIEKLRFLSRIAGTADAEVGKQTVGRIDYRVKNGISFDRRVLVRRVASTLPRHRSDWSEATLSILQ